MLPALKSALALLILFFAGTASGTVQFCSNSHFKTAPGWKPDNGVTYNSCCGDGKICATYNGNHPYSTYAACMTKSTCKGYNGGKLYKKKGGWDCRPVDNNPFPKCQFYFAP